jgi:hypothetical protein
VKGTNYDAPHCTVSFIFSILDLFQIQIFSLGLETKFQIHKKESNIIFFRQETGIQRQSYM